MRWWSISRYSYTLQGGLVTRYFFSTKATESLKYNRHKGGSLSDSQIAIVTFKLYLMVCLRSIFEALHIVKPLKIIYFPLSVIRFN